MWSREIRWHAQNKISILDSNSQHNWDDQNNVTKHKILHFDNEQGIHTSSKNYEESGHGLNLDLLTISY